MRAELESRQSLRAPSTPTSLLNGPGRIEVYFRQAWTGTEEASHQAATTGRETVWGSRGVSNGMVRVEIVWLGHSCFRLKGKDVTIITDPFDPTSGYSLGKVSAEVVTISHDSPDHSYYQGIGGDPKDRGWPRRVRDSGALLTGVGTRRDSRTGTPRDATRPT